MKVVEQDQVRYQKELKDLNTKGYFINKNGENSKDLQKAAFNKKFTQTGVQPKKVLSAYMFYMIEIQATIRAKNPDAKIAEVSKQISEQWNNLKDSEKNKWNNLNIKDKTRREKELN